ncbi:alpha/beta-hydrolase [Macrolepiota fuliginosa MF-IS2]|uniref:Alpha/beta-hydrolase n=1 Tax=Macrolepiota fuliginosa MF-IS2 TaxID=1400762 RepID=A0A9P6CAS6_9AGAR|nr:alpha/beta-hydrolase [Macrolepiota fuliginosa MF-IS2]
MAYPLLHTATLLLGVSLVLAAPITLAPRQGTFSTLSTADVDKFRPLTFFASSAYCPANQTKNWSCGANCDANPNFQPTSSGGDGNDVQFWYVGFDPDLSTIIVAHQGTDPSKIMPLLEDADILPENLDSTLFPNISDSIKVHSGFAGAHADTAQDVLAAVQTTMQTHSTNKVTVSGHSLGAAIGLLDAVFLPLHIPNIDLEMIGYGLPRVGNQDFADFIDSNVKLTRITNKKDPVPTLPGRFLGFHHPASEIHIESSDGSFVSCPGQDNTDARCSVGDVGNIFESKLSDHDGPYAGVEIGC